MKMKKHAKAIGKFLTDKNYRFLVLAGKGKYDKMPDEQYLKKFFKAKTGCELNLENPKSFSEKLQWLKLHDRKDIYTVMADKYLMKEFVTERIGEGHVVPLLGVYDSPDEIDFSKLPNQFVLKCNHNSGLGMYICKDKSKLSKRDVKRIKKNLAKGLAQDYYLHCREWPYKNIKRKIIAEEFLKETTHPNLDCLIDYKWFCFDGEPKIMYIGTDASAHPACDWFDMDFNFLDVHDKDPNSAVRPSKPADFEEMKKYARILAQGTKFLRVDFYVVNGNVYVGELTFFHNGGTTGIKPEKMDLNLEGASFWA